jgi:hypothetical protein
MKRKLTAITVTIFMILTLLPITALAGDVLDWNEFINDAAWSSGGTITLQNDITTPDGTNLTLEAYSATPVTINTNGHTIIIDTSVPSNPSTITLGAYVTITGNGTEPLLKVADKSTLQINGTVVSSTGSASAIRVYGSMDMNSGSIAGADLGVDVYGDASFSGGTVTATGTGLRSLSGSNVVIDGTDITSFIGIEIGGGGIVTMNSGTLHSSSDSGTGIKVGNGTITVNGGSITTSGAANFGIMGVATAVININGGTIASADSFGVEKINGGAVNINGGTITGRIGVYVYNNCTVNASGGNVQSSNIDGSAIELNGNCTGNISGGVQLIGGGNNGCGLLVRSDSIAHIAGGDFSGANGIRNFGIIDISNGSIEGTNGSGIRAESASSLLITGGVIEGSINGILNGGNLDIQDGTISGNTCGITGDGTVIHRSGTISGTDTNGTGLWLSGSGYLNNMGGLITGVETGVYIASSASATLYNGSISATGASSTSSICTENDPTVILYSIVSVTGPIDYGTAAPVNFITRDSFAITVPTPLNIDLTAGQDEIVDFTVQGQRLPGDTVTLQDQLGTSGSLSNTDYTVSGNSISFTNTTVGDSSIHFSDNITHGGNWTINVHVTAAPDITPPTVTGVTPGGTGTSVSGNIVITFNEAMDTTAVGAVSLDGGGTFLTGGSWSADALTYTVPYSGLSFSTSYTVAVSGFEDEAGNAMTADSTHSFTTRSAPSGGGGSSATTYYTITATAGEGGSISPSGSSSIAYGNDKTYTIAAEEGYEIEDVLVDTVSVGAVSTYTFENVTKTHTITAVFAEKETVNPFTDMSKDDWFYGNVMYVYENSLMTGTRSDVFSPYIGMTRAMLVTVLHRLSGDTKSYTNIFTDVGSGTWYENAVAWAAANKIAGGTGNDCFAPDMEVSREQFAVMLYNYAKYKGLDVAVGKDTNILSYNDALSISDYAYTALQWACGSGIINGDDNGNLNPQNSATRAEVAAMLQRFIENVIK